VRAGRISTAKDFAKEVLVDPHFMVQGTVIVPLAFFIYFFFYFFFFQKPSLADCYIIPGINVFAISL
jgi:hypothetical protein